MLFGMAENREELPLFLLSSVLFPHASVRLHVFEDRYRQMVRDCLDEDRPFGIVLIREGSEVGGPAKPYLVGTVVRIKQVFDFDDGTMDLHVQGERRFRIRQIDEESKPYLIGSAEPVEDFPYDQNAENEALVARTRDAFQTWFAVVLARQEFAVTVQFPPEWTALSFAIANFLPVDDLEKQRLLEITDTMERFEIIAQVLEDQIVLGTVQPRFARVHSSELADWVSSN